MYIFLIVSHPFPSIMWFAGKLVVRMIWWKLAVLVDWGSISQPSRVCTNKRRERCFACRYMKVQVGHLDRVALLSKSPWGEGYCTTYHNRCHGLPARPHTHTHTHTHRHTYTHTYTYKRTHIHTLKHPDTHTQTLSETHKHTSYIQTNTHTYNIMENLDD